MNKANNGLNLFARWTPLLFISLFVLCLTAGVFAEDEDYTEDPLYEGMHDPNIRYLYANMTPGKEVFPAKNDSTGTGFAFIRINKTSDDFSFLLLHSLSDESVLVLTMGKSNASLVSSILHPLKYPVSPFRSDITLNKTTAEASGLLNFTTASKFYMNLRTWDHIDGAIRSQIWFNQYNKTASEFISILSPINRGGLHNPWPNATKKFHTPKTLVPAISSVVHNFTAKSIKLIVQHSLDPADIFQIVIAYFTPTGVVNVASFNGSKVPPTGRFYGKAPLNENAQEALYHGNLYVLIEMINGPSFKGRLIQTDTDKLKPPPDLSLTGDQIIVIAFAFVIVGLMMVAAVIKSCIIDRILKKRKAKKQQEKHASLSEAEMKDMLKKPEGPNFGK
jgi:hypothetical protein